MPSPHKAAPHLSPPHKTKRLLVLTIYFFVSRSAQLHHPVPKKVLETSIFRPLFPSRRAGVYHATPSRCQRGTPLHHYRTLIRKATLAERMPPTKRRAEKIGNSMRTRNSMLPKQHAVRHLTQTDPFCKQKNNKNFICFFLILQGLKTVCMGLQK